MKKNLFLLQFQFHSTIKIKPPDINSSTYIDFSVENDPKFEVIDNIRISKYKNIFGKFYIRYWSEEVFVI